MGLPDVRITRGNGNLGRLAVSEDGIAGIIVSGVAVAGPDGFALTDVLGPFNELADAEARGITEAYDTTNTCLAWRHIKDFYDYAPAGSKLYVMVVAKTVLMAEMADKDELYATKLIDQAEGKIRILGITRVPDGAYVPAYTDELENDMWTAVDNAQELQEEEFSLRHRPFSIIMEGRNWQGDISQTKDLRDAASSPEANRVTIMIGGDPEVRSAHAGATAYAAVGIALGKAAAVPVNRNIGRVKDGKLKVITVDFSSGDVYSDFTLADLNDLNDKGYVFFRNHIGKPGYFFNDDHTASVITDDFSYLNRGRTLDKACRITRQVYIEDLLDEVLVDQETGKLPPSTIKHYQGSIETAIEQQMVAVGELSGVNAFVDENQNVLSTDKIVTQLNLVPTGTAREIHTTVAYENPAIS